VPNMWAGFNRQETFAPVVGSISEGNHVVPVLSLRNKKSKTGQTRVTELL
jgi:hypothetical protein